MNLNLSSRVMTPAFTTSNNFTPGCIYMFTLSDKVLTGLAIVVVVGLLMEAKNANAAEVEPIDPKTVYTVESCQIVGDSSSQVQLCFIGSNSSKQLILACIKDIANTNAWTSSLGMRIGDKFIAGKPAKLWAKETFTIDQVLGNTKLPIETSPCLISRYSGLKPDYLTSGDQ